MSAVLLAGLLAVPLGAAGPMHFDCALALMTPQRQLTAPTPVAISFVAGKDGLRDIHVVDTGGILYPGGNMKLVAGPDASRLETIPLPPERPGAWRGKVEKKMYRLTLQSGAAANAVEIALGRVPAGETGRLGLVWNATYQPEGIPQPLSGSGAGNCAAVDEKDTQ